VDGRYGVGGLICGLKVLIPGSLCSGLDLSLTASASQPRGVSASSS